jgi:hypothetical protein
MPAIKDLTIPSIDPKVVQTLAKNYHPLLYFPRLSNMLRDIFPERIFENNSKYDLHRLINDTVLENYQGESLLKYKLFQRYFNKKSIVGAYEIPVNKSRADFLAINGSTTSFEIKSVYDNFTKFNKQAADYLQVFEFNYLVVDQIHLEKAINLLPETFGLLTFKKGVFKKIIKSIQSNKIDPESQLNLLSKKELTTWFREEGDNIKQILQNSVPEIINSKFKKILKSRYQSRWDFIIRHYEAILPVDFQFFFNTNVDPKYIYYY